MKNILILAALATTFAACQKEESCGQSDNTQPIKVSALMEGLTPGTKTSDDGSNATWVANDVIGVFCTQSAPAANNQQYTYSGGTWSSTPLIYWGNYTTPHKFYAYTPYASGSTSTAALVPALNTQTGTIASSQNLLFSNNLGPTGVTKSTNNGTAALTFIHALTLIQLNITVDASVTLSATLTSATITGLSTDSIAPTNSATTLNLTNGTFQRSTAVSNTVTATPASAPTLSTSTPVTLNILILPGSYTPTLTLQCTIGSNTPAASISMGSGATAYAQNTKYIYTVTVSRAAITITASTPIPWVSGGTSSINPVL